MITFDKAPDLAIFLGGTNSKLIDVDFVNRVSSAVSQYLNDHGFHSGELLIRAPQPSSDGYLNLKFWRANCDSKKNVSLIFGLSCSELPSTDRYVPSSIDLSDETLKPICLVNCFEEAWQIICNVGNSLELTKISVESGGHS